METGKLLVTAVFLVTVMLGLVSYSMYDSYWGESVEIESPNLHYVQILTVSGALSPRQQFPNTHNWKMINQLTPMGMRHSYLIGAEFRQRYIVSKDLLPVHYNYSQLQAHSLDLNYTLQTAQCFMFGLYPPGTGPLLENAVQYNATPPFYVENLAAIQKLYGHDALPHRLQPVPVKHIAPEDDIMLYDGYACAKAEWLINQYIQSQQCQDQLASLYNETVQQQVKTLVGSSLSWQEALELYEALLSEEMHGYSDQSSLLKALEPVYTFYRLKIQLPSEEVKALKAAAYLKHLVSQMNNAVQNKITYKGSFYFGSQEVLIALLELLDVKTEYLLPPPSSTLVVEMHSRTPLFYQYNLDMNFQVRVLYNDIPILCDMCALWDFKNLLDLRFNRWKNLAQDCQL